MRKSARALLLLTLSALIPLAPVAAPPKVKVPPLEFTLPHPQRMVLSNGIVVFLMEDHELPTFDFKLKLRSSPDYEPSPDAFSVFEESWRNGGTEKRTPDQVNLELEKMAADVSISVAADESSVAAACLMKDRDATLAVLVDLLFHPVFRDDRIQLAKEQKIEGLRRKNETPAQIGRRAFRDVMYGASHPYARDPSVENVTALNRATFVKLHKKLVVPDGAFIAVAGDFEAKEMIASLEKLFSGWSKAGHVPARPDYTPKPTLQGDVFVVNKVAAQSRISLGRIGVSRHDPDTFPLMLADYILGGGGTSRLFAEIRSRRGLAYVVGSFFQNPTGPGMAGVVCQTQTATSVEALQAIRDVLTTFAKEGPTPQEVQLAKDATIQSFVFSYESPVQIVDAYSAMEFLGYPLDYYDTYRAKVAAVTADDIRRVAQKYFRPDGMKVVVVGDQANFKGEFAGWGKVVELPVSAIE